MLVVKVEVWPRGNGSRAFEIARLGLANVSGSAPVSDYVMTALLARERDEVAVRSEINKHERDLGWAPLVRRAVSSLLLDVSLLQPLPYDDPVANLLRGEMHG